MPKLCLLVLKGSHHEYRTVLKWMDKNEKKNGFWAKSSISRVIFIQNMRTPVYQNHFVSHFMGENDLGFFLSAPPFPCI